MANRRSFLIGGLLASAIGRVSSRLQGARSRADDLPTNSYQAPSFKSGTRILFQGDSITDMKRGRNESDRNHYLGHSYVFMIAAKLGIDMPGVKLDFFNRGVSGNRVSDLKIRWQSDSLDLKPDVLSILIGTNDAGKNLDGVDMKEWESDYRFILDANRSANEKLRIVLLDPFVLPTGRIANNQTYDRRRKQVERMLPIVAQLCQDYDAVHIKTQKLFDNAAEITSAPDHWLWDGVHPLPQGHELIARQWLASVGAKWK